MLKRRKKNERKYPKIMQNMDNEDAEIIQQNVEEGVPVNEDLNVCEDENHLALWPLIAAAAHGDLTTVQSLLKQVPDKNVTTDLGRTALWYATARGHLEIVRLLLEQGADKEKTDLNGWTPLYIAAYNDHLPIVQLLVGGGADMENTDLDGRTPLYVASREGKVEVARYLLEQGADRDKAWESGETPLQMAVFYGHLELAKLLMVYGADLNARDNNGQLPIDQARSIEMMEAIRDEPRRRMDHGHKRATEQDRHPNAATSTSAQQEGEVEDVAEPSNKKPRLNEDDAEEGQIAEEDQDSEPSSDEEDN